MTKSGQVEKIPKQQQHIEEQKKHKKSKSLGRFPPKEKIKALNSPSRAKTNLGEALIRSYKTINGPANV